APPRDPGDRRQEIPAAVVLEDGRLAARGPRPVAVRALGQSAFVDEHDRLPLRGSIFFPRATARASRGGSPPRSAPARGPPAAGSSSRAAGGGPARGRADTPRRTSPRSNTATRHAVHKLVSKPRASDLPTEQRRGGRRAGQRAARGEGRIPFVPPTLPARSAVERRRRGFVR